MEIRQTQKLSQKLALTPQMKQSIQILQLPLLELKDFLEKHVEENPVLESEKSSRSLEESLEEKSIKTVLQLSERDADGIDAYITQEAKDMDKKQRYRESLITKEPNLQEFLLKQLRLLKLDKKGYTIGEAIIADIDENGYVKSSPGEILALLNKNKKEDEEKISKKDIEEVLSLIQGFEPTGVGARSLKECLFIQLKAQKKHNTLAYKIVESHLGDLAKRNLKAIAKKLKKPVQAVDEAARIIASLEPKPGRILAYHEPLDRKPILPDIILEKIGDRYELIINTRGLPRLMISKRYRQLLKSKTTSDDIKKYITKKMQSALWLIKAVIQREETIKRISQCILNVQKEFIEHGDFSTLKPLTLKEVARIIKRNESTVSRVVNSKYIQTPVGTFKLNCFFSTHLKTHKGEKISTENIKSLISDAIGAEDPLRPLKDEAIARLLKNQGIKIARRTVAKYREELKIPSYNQRKKKD
jgi:RNA polymerase sigma-54 factor